MTPTEIKSIRLGLGLTQRQLEVALGLAPSGGRTVRRWEAGTVTITGPCAKLLRIFEKEGLK